MLAIWGCTTFPKATLDLDFAGATSLDNRITFARASTATYFDSNGVLQSASNGVARFDHDPVTGEAKGLLIEEQRTNRIRNNTMQGVVAGTPGTLPTNWLTQLNGLTQTIVGTGTSNGINYIDIRFNGTTTGAGSTQIKLDGNASVTGASSSQSWTTSTWVSVIGGSTANFSAMDLVIGEYSAGPTFLRNTAAATNILSGGGTFTRVSGSITTGASTTILEPYIRLAVAGAVAIDITLRIGLPQLEQGAFATSVIPTTTTALTRSADVASMTGTNFSEWYNAAEGAIYVEYNERAFSQTHQIVYLSSSSANERINLSVNSSNTLDVQVVTSGSDSFGGNAPTLTSGDYKIAFAYATNNAGVSINGSSVTTDTSVTLPTGVDRLFAGTTLTGSQPLNSTIKKISYYPSRLSNAQLQALTG